MQVLNVIAQFSCSFTLSKREGSKILLGNYDNVAVILTIYWFMRLAHVRICVKVYVKTQFPTQDMEYHNVNSNSIDDFTCEILKRVTELS